MTIDNKESINQMIFSKWNVREGKFSRNSLTLDQAMKFIRAKWTDEPFIKYDLAVKSQYEIRRQSSHDGTVLFSFELMRKAFMPLFQRSSYFKSMGEPDDSVDIRYTIGKIKVVSACGMVDLPCGRVMGMSERVIIPVFCEYVGVEKQ